MHAKFQIIEDRLQSQDWFLSEGWSVIDAYLFWVYFRLDGTAFDVSAYPAFTKHYKTIQQRPSVKRAIAFEMKAGMSLKEKGLMVNFETFRPGDKPEDFIAQIGD